MAQLSALGIVVRDMAQSLQFYRALGLDIPASMDAEGHAEFVTSGGFRIMWDTEELIKSIYPEWVRPVGQGMTLAFSCATPAEVDALYAQVLKSGYQGHKAPWDAFWGQRYAVVIDPDGNLVDLFAALS